MSRRQAVPPFQILIVSPRFTGEQDASGMPASNFSVSLCWPATAGERLTLTLRLKGRPPLREFVAMYARDHEC